jgi:hypothetical protein
MVQGCVRVVDHGDKEQGKIVGIMKGREGESKSENSPVSRENKKFDKDGEIEGSCGQWAAERVIPPPGRRVDPGRPCAPPRPAGGLRTWTGLPALMGTPQAGMALIAHQLPTRA